MVPIPTLDRAFTSTWRPGLTGGMDSDDIMRWYHAVIPTLASEARMVEIGVAWGRSLIFAAELSAALGHTGRIYGVDPWNGPGVGRVKSQSVMSYHAAVEHVCKNCSPLELDLVCLLRMTSVQAAELFDCGQLDLVMIDGDHEESAVIEDIEAWEPKVNRGGFLSGHDYDPRFPGVIAAVDDYFRGHIQLRGTVWIVAK